MNSGQAYLFVYGTLRKDLSRMSGLIAGDIEWVGVGSIPGKLYDLGSYPGAVEDSSGETLIRGEIMLIREAEKVFRLLDRYEGFYPDNPGRSAFIRKKQMVLEDTGSTREAWMYWYNLSVEGKPEIPGKDYLEYLKEKGKRK